MAYQENLLLLVGGPGYIGYRAFIEADVKRWRVLVDAIGRDRLVAPP